MKDEDDEVETVVCSICGKEVKITGLAALFEAIGEASGSAREGFCHAIGEDFVCDECWEKHGEHIQKSVAEA